MMPWFTVLSMEKAHFAINRTEAEMRGAITKGVERLLSMQTNNGALGFWPGAREPNLCGQCLWRHGDRRTRTRSSASTIRLRVPS